MMHSPLPGLASPRLGPGGSARNEKVQNYKKTLLLLNWAKTHFCRLGSHFKVRDYHLNNFRLYTHSGCEIIGG